MHPEEELFLQHLALIERVAGLVGKRAHLEPLEIEEFVSCVKVRMIEHDYAIIRKFEGRSSFSTYITTVITRMFSQHRDKAWGKWRPSAEAKRLGETAIKLEQLVVRDGSTFDEAYQLMTTRLGVVSTRGELESIHRRLPSRIPRPMLVATNEVPDCIGCATTDGDMLAAERERTARSAAHIVNDAIASMGEQDQEILRMRFGGSCKVPDIAESLALDQKKLYKRIDKMLASLRRALEAAGIGRGEISEVLAHGDTDVRMSRVSGDSWGSPLVCLSDQTGSDAFDDGEPHLSGA